MSKKICIIHPIDSTTDFLVPIYNEIDEAFINLLRLKDKESHSNFFLNPPDENLVLYLGHGTSNSLSGAMTNEHEIKIFISEKQLTVLKSKVVVLFSCRSNQYIKKYSKECRLKNGIGFPNMITDYSEIGEYDDPERASGLTKENIEEFKQILVGVMKHSLHDLLYQELNVYQYFNRIKLRVNKAILEHYSRKYASPWLGKMLLDLREGLFII